MKKQVSRYAVRFAVLSLGLILTAPNVSSAGGMNSSSGSSQMMTVLSLGVNGVVMYTTCKACAADPSGIDCAMCAMTGLQIVETLSADSGSRTAKRDTACSGSTCYNQPTTTTTLYNNAGDPNAPTTTLYPGGGGPNDPNGDGDPNHLFSAANIDPDKLKADAEKNLAAMAAKGYKVNADGSVSTPGGKISGSAFNSAGGMSAAGFSAKDIKRRNELMEKANAYGKNLEDQLSKLEGDEGGGGGYAGSDSGGAKKDYNPFNLNNFLPKPSKEVGKPSVSGLSKAHGSDQIGVASDNLFQMIDRSYQSQRKSGGFIEQDTGGKPTTVPPAPGVGD